MGYGGVRPVGDGVREGTRRTRRKVWDLGDVSAQVRRGTREGRKEPNNLEMGGNDDPWKGVG